MDLNLLIMFRVCHAFLSVHCLLGKDYPLGSLVCDVFLCFCRFKFPMWFPGSGVVLDCIHCLSLASYLL